MNDDILVHYGVPGMKWGVRKRRPSSGRSKKKKGVVTSVKKAIADHDKKKKAKAAAKEAANTKDINITIKSGSKSFKYGKRDDGTIYMSSKYGYLSDAELKTFVTRLNMEKQFYQLTAPQKKAKADIGKVLKTVGTVSMKAGAVIGILGGAEWLAKKYNLTEEQSKNLEKTLKILETIGK